jgi:hypothetical protein
MQGSEWQAIHGLEVGSASEREVDGASNGWRRDRVEIHEFTAEDSLGRDSRYTSSSRRRSSRAIR